jgi:hypothetical protein
MSNKRDADGVKLLEAIREAIERTRAKHADNPQMDPIEKFADAVLSIRPEFFQLLELDSSNLLHRGFLFGIVLDSYLSCRPKKKGRPKGTNKWTRKKFMQLGAALEFFEHIFPGVSNKKAAQLIRKIPNAFAADADSIRKRIPEARRVWNTGKESVRKASPHVRRKWLRQARKTRLWASEGPPNPIRGWVGQLMDSIFLDKTNRSRSATNPAYKLPEAATYCTRAKADVHSCGLPLSDPARARRVLDRPRLPNLKKHAG